MSVVLLSKQRLWGASGSIGSSLLLHWQDCCCTGQRGWQARGCQLCAMLRLLVLGDSWLLALCAVGLLCECSWLLAG